MKTLIISIALFANFAYAGTGVTGGEHSIDDTPVDIAKSAMAAAQPMDPTALPAYANEVVPMLNRLGGIPGFAKAMKSILIDKRWFFTDEKMSECGGGASMVNLNLTTRACQSKNIVVVDKAWLLRDSTNSDGSVITSLEKQKITLVHEMLRGLALKNPEIEEIDLQMMVRVLLGYQGALPDDNSLARELKKLGFGDYTTASMIQQGEAIKKKISKLDDSCSPRDPDQEVKCKRALTGLKTVRKTIEEMEISKSLRDQLIDYLNENGAGVVSVVQRNEENAQAVRAIMTIRNGSGLY